ncbi:hypothetical protein [Mesorhizobium sp. CAU 1732]|uniref:hypothetical protein n=1 Tax=Mesorhizobium sp. CAU 1732 TaxID=3140358 RepID=UPI0032607179
MMSRTHDLTLKWTTVTQDADDISFWDMIVSGQSLYHAFGSGNVCILGSVRLEFEPAVIDRLLLVEPGDYPSGRVALYVCSYCAHLDCGAISVQITREGPHIVWSDFRDTHRHDEEGFEAIDAVGPFRFEFAAYRDALLGRTR